MNVHRLHDPWIITQGLVYESSFAVVLVHTITTSIQGSKCFYQQKWITVQLLSSNGPSHLFWLIQEQLNYPSGSASSGYILIVYIQQYKYANMDTSLLLHTTSPSSIQFTIYEYLIL